LNNDLSPNRNNQAGILQSLIGVLPSGIMIADSSGIIRSANKILLDMVGFHARCAGIPIHRFPPFLIAGIGAKLTELLNQHRDFNTIIENETSDGQIQSLKLQARSVLNEESVREYVIVVQDDTERKKKELLVCNLEQQLKKSQRMESFGLLAAGIAHDLNNVLSCIMGAGEILVTTIDENLRQTKLVGQIIEATERGAEMTRKVLSLVRLEEEELRPVDVNQVVRDVLMLLKRSIHPRIRIQSDLTSTHCAIIGDNTKVHQIMMNLCVNARDAIQDEGSMELRTDCISAVDAANLDRRTDDSVWLVKHRDEAICNATDNKKFILIEVYDSGSGIAEAILERIFNPFFTTKPKDRGTGLGLSMVLNAAREMGGFLTISSHQGRGTRFQIVLPKLEDEGKVLSVSPERQELDHGNGLILVVDDDETVRLTTCEMLVQLGYCVEEASDGYEAIDMVEAKSEPYNLIILDLLMPKMDGIETLRRVIKLHEEQAVLIVSGFANDKIIKELHSITTVDVVTKPFRFDNFSKIVSRLIN